jgi:hypothetical protein
VKQCVSCPGRGAAFFTLLRRAGTPRGTGPSWTPDLQRTASRCAASGARQTLILRGREACVSCPGRGAAFFTLLRRAGTHGYGSIMAPDLQRTASRRAASGARQILFLRGRGVKQCVSCPGRGAAFFTLLRRAGTHGYVSIIDPGSAAHRFALRSVRGTANPHPEGCALRRGSRRMRWPMVRDGANAPPHHEDLRPVRAIPHAAIAAISSEISTL